MAKKDKSKKDDKKTIEKKEKVHLLNKKTREQVARSIKNGEDESTVLISMVEKGVPFNKAQRYLNEILEDSGIRVSNKRLEEIFLEEVDVEELDNYTQVQSTIDFMKERVQGADEKQILRIMRKSYRAKGFELPRKAKRTTAFATQVENWMIENPEASNDDLTKHITKDLGKNETSAKRFIKMFEFAKKFSDAS